jgi:glycosyltransferase involved in cell wall biosynthesis
MNTDATQPLVSVILPSYNHARYLPRRIESISNQTYPNIEVLILDDCSPDNSREVIREYAARDSRIEVYFNEHNSGSTFKQWQKGLDWAKGKYIWIAESDDFAEPAFLEQLIPMLEADDAVVLAHSNSNVVDENDYSNSTTADWKNEYYHTNHWGVDHVADGREEIELYFQRGCIINNVSAVVFRRASIDAVGGVDMSFRYTGDWLLYLKLGLVGKFAYRAACLSNYRDHASNTTKKSYSDGSQLFERQRCFIFLYRAKVLSPAGMKRLLTTASGEYIMLAYELLRRNWRPKLFASYTRRLAGIDLQFYLHMQTKVVRTLARGDY